MIELPFYPLPGLSSGHLQTIVGSYGLPLTDPPSKLEWLTIDERTKLCNVIFTPNGWQPENGIVIMLHGLGGSHKSHYMRRLSAKFYNKGMLVVCINRQGCGPGEGFSSRLSHGGLTTNILHILKKVHQSNPLAPIHIIGFSVGGNLLLKLLGELGTEGSKYLTQAIAVCPSTDLKASSENLIKPSNRLYDQYYVKGLKKLIRSAEKAFPDEPKTAFPKLCNIIEYDELYTAPKWGYSSAYDYYAKNSSGQFIPNIKVPCKILLAEDDPFIKLDQMDNILIPDSVTVYKTKHGGHMGYLGCPKGENGVRWMDSTLLSWIITH